VPATWITGGSRRSGWPSAASRRSIRPSDKSMVRGPPVIHVAGTNGKGSTIATMRAILEAGGLSAHVYTDPSERQIDGARMQGQEARHQGVGGFHRGVPRGLPNGKGSTIATMRAILEAGGLSAHVYTSPHLVRFHERREQALDPSERQIDGARMQGQEARHQGVGGFHRPRGTPRWNPPTP
jgi:hypothetical protein